jgi:hypothetical protein
MSNVISGAIVIGMLFASVVKAADKITCYDCTGTSASGSKCIDPFEGSDSVGTCTGEQCYKTSSSVNGVQTVIRSCYATSTGSNKCEGNTVDGVSGKLCTCDTDKCNAAVPVIRLPSRSAVFAVGLVATVVCAVIGA